ncbi:MlaD family protein [Ferrimonas lipolytica]|uniref:MCE family protein n=1 Tax=Ferrimonas lipolytica TaxID=2724191 RepID=A0A6H1UBW3_9GAMM|nr:MlaD family protein [Ferrimonas lipolytica]QIZ76551.1 MCE family protein [Ferrimonas lipolytica]
MSSETQAPLIKRKKTLSPVWILPLLAAILGLWLLVNYIQERGSDINVQFASATGIEANKTFVRYQGIVVGRVIDVRLANDNSSVDVTIRMQNSVEGLLKSQTTFWLVQPKASLTGIDGLDALFSGNYIAMQPGEGRRTTSFIGSEQAPSLVESGDGLLVHLKAPDRGSLTVGSGVYFQKVKVGELVDFTLAQDGSGVEFAALIEAKYQTLVRQGSRFWNVSGARLKANRKGLDVDFESLATLLAGGIAFSSPNDSPKAESSQRFELYKNEQSTNLRSHITLTALNANGLNVGSSIRFRGIDLGQIESIELGEEHVELHGWIDSRHQHLLRQGTEFSRVSANIGLDGISHLETIVFGDFIRLWPGDGSPQQHFTLLENPPEDAIQGRHFILNQTAMKGVSIGAPIRYRGVVVGEVLDATLAADSVDIEILIEPDHQQLIRKNSRFWLDGAIDIKADLSRLQLTAAPLQSALTGGISFSSSSQAEQAEAMTAFTLYDNRDDALTPAPMELALTTTTLNGLSVGAPIYYRNLETGRIDAIELNDNSLEVKVEIDHQYRYLINANTRFWHYSGVEIEGSLGGINIRTNPLTSMIRGGLSFGHTDEEIASAPFSNDNIYLNEHQALASKRQISLTLSTDGRIDSNAAIRYLGHKIGEVKQVTLTADLSQQVIVAELEEPWANQFMRSDSQYYLVQPKVALSGIRNVDTILAGNHIASLPGKNDASQTNFVIAIEEPLQTPYGDGLRLVLNQQRLGSLHIGSPVLYRQIRVGEVIHTRLTGSGDSVDIEIQFQPQFQHLVNSSSKFWNASGVDIDFGVFSGADIKTESLETILAGGVAFATESPTSDKNRVSDGQRMRLYDKVKLDWLEWQPKF